MAEVIVIVGMHRSGTSCLAGSLQEAGLELGEVVTQAPHNAKGNRENRRIMTLHDAVLADGGGSWDDPPATARWSDAQRRERDSIIGDYVGFGRWGFKDPRSLFTLGGWLEVLDRVKLIGTLRHPAAVAASLVKRNGGTVERWLDLWRRYNERLLALHGESPFPIVDFDRDDASYRAALPAVLERLGLSRERPRAFFAPELRHHSVQAAELPPAVEALYRSLKSLTE